MNHAVNRIRASPKKKKSALQKKRGKKYRERVNVNFIRERKVPTKHGKMYGQSRE